MMLASFLHWDLKCGPGFIAIPNSGSIPGTIGSPWIPRFSDLLASFVLVSMFSRFFTCVHPLSRCAASDDGEAT